MIQIKSKIYGKKTCLLFMETVDTLYRCILVNNKIYKTNRVVYGVLELIKHLFSSSANLLPILTNL